MPTVLVRLEKPDAPKFGARDKGQGRFDINLTCEGYDQRFQQWARNKLAFESVTPDTNLPIVTVSVEDVDNFATCVNWRATRVEKTWKLVRNKQWKEGNKWFEV